MSIGVEHPADSDKDKGEHGADESHEACGVLLRFEVGDSRGVPRRLLDLRIGRRRRLHGRRAERQRALLDVIHNEILGLVAA
jgi:hypothetical protein